MQGLHYLIWIGSPQIKKRRIVMAVEINIVGQVSSQDKQSLRLAENNYLGKNLKNSYNNDDAVIIALANNSIQLGNLPKVQASALIKLNLFDANQDGEVTQADTIHRNQVIAQHSAPNAAKKVQAIVERRQINEKTVSVRV